MIEEMASSVRSEHTELEQDSEAPCACESSDLRVRSSAAASVLVSSGAQVSLHCWQCISLGTVLGTPVLAVAPQAKTDIGGNSHLGAT